MRLIYMGSTNHIFDDMTTELAIKKLLLQNVKCVRKGACWYLNDFKFHYLCPCSDDKLYGCLGAATYEIILEKNEFMYVIVENPDSYMIGKILY